jgi:aryl-alcohol dehydrogenase-like predicted oxidoreductase
MSDASPHTILPIHRLGGSELEVSVVGLGCNNFGRRLDLEGTMAVLDTALAAGVTRFDTADVYGGADSSERLRLMVRPLRTAAPSS